MNFSYGIIAAVGVLVAISLGFIADAPDDIIESRVIPVEEKPTMCTMDYVPVCGIDGKTYGNLCMLNASDVKLDYEGECVVAEAEVMEEPEAEVMEEPEAEVMEEPEAEVMEEPEAEVMEEPEAEVMEEPEAEVMEEPEAEVMALTVSVAEGSGVPGCEETNECYLPYEITVAVGTTVTWSNDDSAAHTVTSGNISDGTDGVFDSGLFMSGSIFEFTFDDTGTYDYFCMVHPWMTGVVIVNEIGEMPVVSEQTVIEEPEAEVMEEPEAEVMEEPEAEVMEEPEAEVMALTVSVAEGSGVPGCEETNECYLPYEITVAVGTTVTWSNDDSAAHTVTSGSIDAGLTGVFDSGLFMSGSIFEFTFDDTGTYDYFCMVHPWMTGIVQVS